MAKKPKTRFTITVDGLARELLSVREGPQGDLIVVIKKTDEMTFGDYHGALDEQRYSIHPSHKSDGFTITHRVLFKEEVKADTYSHVKPIAGRFCWIVSGRACADLSPPQYISTPRGQDTMVSLGAYDPSLATFCYFVIASDRETNLRHEFSGLPLNVVSKRYGHFTFWLLYGFLNLPSTPMGAVTAIATAPPRLNGEDLGERPEEIFAFSPGLGELAPLVAQVMMRLSEDNLRRLREKIDFSKILSPAYQSAAMELSQFYSKAPLVSR